MLRQAAPAQNDPFHSSMLAAQAFVAKQDFISAERAFRQALMYQTKSPPALAGLGQVLCLLNRIGDGVPLLFQAGTILAAQLKVGGNFKQLLDLAYQLLNRHAPQAALALAESALQIDPRAANALHIASLCLQSLNRHNEAYAYSLRAVELVPQEANAFIQLGVLEAKLGMSEQARQHFEYAIGKATHADAARAHRELGILLDKMGEYAAAFRHISQSGKMILESPAIRHLNPQSVFGDIANLKAAFDAEFLASAATRQPKDDLPTPIFLVGFYRSGTTLAEQILATHPKLTSSDEAFLLQPVLQELAVFTDTRRSLTERLKSLDTAAVSRLRQLYWRTATDILGPQAYRKVLVDKTAMNILNLELINALFPEAPLVFALRDPRDVCLSCFMQPFGLSALTANFLTWNGTAHFYALIMDYWLSIRNNLSMPILELRYEQVILDPKGVFQPIFAAVGLDWSEECNSFYQHARRKVISTPSFDQVTQPLYQSSQGRWRNYLEQIAEIHPLLIPYIQAYEYDLNLHHDFRLD